MPDPKAPQDHKKKAEKVEEYFTFTSGGEQFTMPKKTLDVVTTKFVRENRRRSETDFAMTAVELLAGDDEEGERILAAFDAMSREEFKRFDKAFGAHLGAALGE